MGKNEKKPVGRPKGTGKDHSKASSAERGTAPGYMRKSYLVNIDASNKIDAIAYWDRKTLKDTLYDAMKLYIATWEKKNGPVKPTDSKS